jgi:hypothetical protein
VFISINRQTVGLYLLHIAYITLLQRHKQETILQSSYTGSKIEVGKQLRSFDGSSERLEAFDEKYYLTRPHFVFFSGLQISERIVMISLQRTLLRLHIEAVWGVHLPPITQNNIELLGAGPQPPWKLCAAEMESDRVNIWRPGAVVTERDELLTRVNEALALSPTESAAPGISREVALHQVTSPTISITTALTFARPLTSHDQALVESFQSGSVEYYFHPDRRPLIGVVAAGRLLSLAHSSRRTSEVCELGVETLPEARHKGYALAATVLWAALIAQEGRVPLYSVLVDNTASLGLATAAGYKAFARTVTIEG